MKPLQPIAWRRRNAQRPVTLVNYSGNRVDTVKEARMPDGTRVLTVEYGLFAIGRGYGDISGRGKP